MKDRLRRAVPDLLAIALLLIVPLALFLPQTIGGKTLIPVDNLFQWQPYRALADEYEVGQPHNALISDLILENTAWKQFAREQIVAGDIPLWQPNILSGTPFLAAGQSSTLYPFNLLFLVFPIPVAYGWFTVSQLWAAGINLYVLARVLGIRRPGALIAALTYELSSFMLVSVVFPMIVATAAWLPLELAMIELVIRQQPVAARPATLPWAAIGAVGLGMAVLAGHVEALYFTLLVMGFFAAWRLIAEAVARRSLPLLVTRAVWLLAMAITGLALGAVQIAPAYELARLSFRQGAVSLDQVLDWAYPPRHILAFLMPNFFGSPAHHAIFDVFAWRWVPVEVNTLGETIHTTEWGIKNYVEGGAYVGILPMLLAGVAVAFWIARLLHHKKNSEAGRSMLLPKDVGAEGPGRPYRAIFAMLGLLAASFAFGTPTYAVLYYTLPFINQSHAPFRWVWPLTLCTSVLAGFGVEVLSRRQDRQDNGDGMYPAPLQTQFTSWAGWGIMAVGAAILASLIASRVFYGRIAGLVEHIFIGLAKAPEAFADAQAFYSYEAGNALVLAVLLILAGGAFLLAGAKRVLPLQNRWPIWQMLAALIVIVDLSMATWGLYPANDPALLNVVPPSIAWLKDQVDPLEPWRFAIYEEPGAKTMNANIGWLHGLEDIGGYDSLIPAQYADYMDLILPQTDLPYNRIAPIYSSYTPALDSPLLDLLGVRYVVSEVEIDHPHYTPVYQDEAVRIYENSGAMPRAFTLPVSSTQVYGGRLFAEETSRSDIRRHVLIETTPCEPSPRLSEATECEFLPTGVSAEPTPATITAYTAQELWIDLDVPEKSWLVVTGSYFPGWRAWMRPLGASDDAEQEVPVYLVDGNFRGMIIPPGTWTVRTKYSPDSFRFGAFASFLTGLALVFAVGVWGWRFIYHEEDEDSGVKRVAKNTITPILLNLFNKGILFVLTFAQLRILGPAGAGDYRYAFTIYGWFEILANFGLNLFLMREVARHKDEANRYFVSTTLLRLMLVVIGIPLLAVFLAIRQTFIAPPQSTATLWTIGLLYSGLFFSTISTGLTALFYAYEKAEYPAAIQTVSAFLTASLGIAALLAGWGIVGLAVVSVLVNFITLAILGTLAMRLFFRPRWFFDWAMQKLAMSESFPLMLNHLLSTLFFRIAVVLLEALKGNIVVGWYGVVYTWVDAVGLIPSLFTWALFPMISRQAAEDRARLKKTYLLALRLMTLLSIPTAIFTTLLAPFLVNVLGGREYLPHGAVAMQIFIWGMIIGWMNSVTQYVIISLNRQRMLTIAFFIVTAFNVIANLLTIPRYSYLAAAVNAILSEFVLWGLFYTIVLSELGRINWLLVLWRAVLAGIVSGAATLLLAPLDTGLAFIAGLATYAVMVVIVRPFDDEEMRQLAPALPAPVRRLLRVAENADASHSRR